MQELVDKAVSAIRDYVHRALDARIRAVEARIVVLESLPVSMQQFRGVWKANDHYHQHQFAVLGGSLWVCKQSGTRSRPGTDSDWQLSAKGGH